MMGEWEMVRLGDFISIKGGLSYKGNLVGTGDSVLVGMGSVSYSERFLVAGTRTYGGEFSETHRLLPGDLVIATRQQSDNLPILGYPARIPFALKGRNVVVATNLYKVFNDSDIDNDFLFWLLRGPEYRKHILSCAKGTTVRMITKDAIEDFRFNCPPPDERREIANFLNSIEDKIELNHQINQTLEQIAQTIFKSWFIDFEPVKAKIEAKAAGRDPDRAAMCAISGKSEAELDHLPTAQYQQLTATAALFPDELVPHSTGSGQASELGLIPVGWEVGTVTDLGEVICGKTPSTSDPENFGDDVPFITIPDMHDKLMVTTTARSLSHKGADTQKKKYLPPGSICVSCIATPGLVVRVTVQSQTNQQINSVVPYEKWGEVFPLLALRRIGAQVMAGGSGGSVFHNLSKSGFEQLRVLLCDEYLAQALDHIVAPLLQHIELKQQEAEALAILRDTLLPKLLFGELKL